VLTVLFYIYDKYKTEILAHQKILVIFLRYFVNVEAALLSKRKWYENYKEEQHTRVSIADYHFYLQFINIRFFNVCFALKVQTFFKKNKNVVPTTRLPRT